MERERERWILRGHILVSEFENAPLRYQVLPLLFVKKAAAAKETDAGEPVGEGDEPPALETHAPPPLVAAN